MTDTPGRSNKSCGFRIISAKKKTCALSYINANYTPKKQVTIPSKIKLEDGRLYKVTQIDSYSLYFEKKINTIVIGKNVKKIAPFSLYPLMSNSFSKIIIKSKHLTKKSVRKCLEGTEKKLTKIIIKVSNNKKINKKYALKYKKYFTKKNCGAKVKIIVK